MAKINIRIPRILLDLRNADPKLLSEMEGALDTLDAKIRVMGTGFSQLPHVFSRRSARRSRYLGLSFKNLPGDFQHTMKAGIIR